VAACPRLGREAAVVGFRAKMTAAQRSPWK
jgi:hypothetical protein